MHAASAFVASDFYSALATAILLLHALFILWVVFGALLTRSRPLLRWLHIASLLWGILTEVLPWPCPLTLLENWLEARAGIEPYHGGFLLHYLDKLVYPATYFVRQIGKPHFWRPGHSLRRDHDNNGAVRRFHYIHSHHLASARHSPSVRRVGDSTDQDPAAEIARRKYAGIMCFPTLAKYLGLIVDVEVEAKFLANVFAPSRSYGLIAASVASLRALGPNLALNQRQTKHRMSVTRQSPAPVISKPSEFVWTRYVLRPIGRVSRAQKSTGNRVQAEYDYFGPSDKDDTDANPGPEGLLKLGQKTESGMRFELSSLDVTNAAERIMALKDDTDSKATLESTKTIPDLLTRGIVLCDTTADIEENKRIARRKEKAEQAKVSSSKVLYAQDLIIGYRRGLATNLHELGVPDKVIQAILRHEDVSTTQRSYIKTVPQLVTDAMNQLEARIARAAVVQQVAVN
jgi:hypothetical protein